MVGSRRAPNLAGGVVWCRATSILSSLPVAVSIVLAAIWVGGMLLPSLAAQCSPKAAT
jgi:hypothetical protein